MRKQNTHCTCDPTTVCDNCRAKPSKAVERARDDVILVARVICEADYGKTYPDLHRAINRLNRAVARVAQ